MTTSVPFNVWLSPLCHGYWHVTFGGRQNLPYILVSVVRTHQKLLFFLQGNVKHANSCKNQVTLVFRFAFERRKLARCLEMSSLQSHNSTSPFMSLGGPQEFKSISFRKHWAAPIAMIIYDFLGLPQKKYNTFRSFSSKSFNTIQCWNLVITFIQFVVTSWIN